MMLREDAEPAAWSQSRVKAIHIFTNAMGVCGFIKIIEKDLEPKAIVSWPTSSQDHFSRGDYL